MYTPDEDDKKEDHESREGPVEQVEQARDPSQRPGENRNSADPIIINKNR